MNMPTLYQDAECETNMVDYLAIDELYAIEDMRLLEEKEDLTRDLFVFSCYTGLTYEEMQYITTDHLTLIDFTPTLDIFFEEPESIREIPLFDSSLQIIKKYNSEREKKQTDKIFPFPMPEKTESHLAKFADLVGIDYKLDFAVARYTFATVIAVIKRLPLEIVDGTEGVSMVEDTTEYQDLIWFDYMSTQIPNFRNIY